MSQPAVFLDRDGTLNEEMGYINHLSRFRMLPQAVPAIRRLNEAGLKVVVVTNQSGAARGYFPAALVDEIHTLSTKNPSGRGRPPGRHLCLPPRPGGGLRLPQAQTHLDSAGGPGPGPGPHPVLSRGRPL